MFRTAFVFIASWYFRTKIFAVNNTIFVRIYRTTGFINNVVRGSVRALINIIGNTISGARVTLRLPYREAPDTHGGLALLVEDSEELRATFRDMLIDIGHSVIEATSADEACALLADVEDIALVLSDIRLEGEATGLDLLTRLQGSGLPCILMTSLPSHDPLHRAALKCSPVLQKPFTADQLSALLNSEVAA
ncbi:MAG: response regulator [Labilibaculum sp.]|nr:response regulator [Labilibaculum sp.]